MDRRTLLKNGLIISTAGLVTTASATQTSLVPTPSETEGPFYPVYPQKDQDFDLTQVEGQTGKAQGKIMTVQGQVLDKNGSPIENATVDLWQANAAGRYRHPHDTNPAPLDPNFQGWAIVQTDCDRLFRFITVYPGAYPATKLWTRPPHIHFKVSKAGYFELSTQMYFPHHPLNEADLLLKRKNSDEQQLMIANKHPELPDQFQHQFVLQRI